VTVADRWAIVAYIKALQLSQNASRDDVAAGAHIEPLGTIAEREGLPATFADEWTVPPTAVTGTPNGQPFVLPGAGSATVGQASGKTVAPAAKTAPAAAGTAAPKQQ
jgi:hypothetical protein